MKNLIPLFALSILILSCEKEIEPEISDSLSDSSNSYVNIHPNLLPYILKFEEEANNRGLSFADELKALETHFENISETNVAGQCSWSSNNPNMVTIDTPFWNNVGSSQREWVVFHELGHCVLYRDHTEIQNNQGICLSVMASGTGSCQSMYNASNREYYLNELFSIQN